jgi:hypothetical protein
VTLSTAPPLPAVAATCYSETMSEASKADWSWLEARREVLSGLAPEAAAELLNEGLAKIDERLEAEVSDEHGTRQVVISANRQADAFDLVRRLVASAPSLPRWKFTALRPARGFEFEFEFEAGGRRIDARALGFVPKKTEGEGLTIRLLVPNPEFEAWPAVAWQIIEAGIGEEAAARLAGVEVGTREDDDHVLGLESLPGYVKRHG